SSIHLSSVSPPTEASGAWRMTPLASRMKRPGQLLTFHVSAIGPAVLPPSHQLRQVRSSFITVFLSASRSLSLLTPSSAKGFPARRFTSDRSCGYISRQPPHQSPQKSSSTTLPR